MKLTPEKEEALIDAFATEGADPRMIEAVTGIPVETVREVLDGDGDVLARALRRQKGWVVGRIRAKALSVLESIIYDDKATAGHRLRAIEYLGIFDGPRGVDAPKGTQTGESEGESGLSYEEITHLVNERMGAQAGGSRALGLVPAHPSPAGLGVSQ